MRVARCCCGDCTISVEGEPALNAVCHCSSCKRRTGTAFGWSTYFPDNAVSAKTGTVLTYAKSGDYERYFCARGGTTLYWKSQAFMPQFTGVAGGCFAETPLPEPQFSAQDADRCMWVTLPTTWAKT